MSSTSARKKKKAKAAPAPPKPPVEDPEDDDDEEAEDLSDDEDAPALNLGTEDANELMQVDFGFFDPREADFHGMRALLSGEQSLLPQGAAWDVGGLAAALCEQVAVGSIVKVIAEGSEEPANDDVLGFMSAVNLHAHRDARFASQLRASLTARCADPAARQKLSALLAEPRTGLLVSARLVNLPAALIPSLVDSVMQDIAWAVTSADDAAERDSFRFSHLLLVARVGLRQGGTAAASSSSSSSMPSDPPAASGGGKKRKKAAAAAATREAEFLESLEFERAEEEVLAAAAQWSALLNGTGRSRQLVMSLTPEAVRAAVPAMHAVMGEA